jgi:hypothetical protein
MRLKTLFRYGELGSVDSFPQIWLEAKKKYDDKFLSKMELPWYIQEMMEN